MSTEIQIAKLEEQYKSIMNSFKELQTSIRSMAAKQDEFLRTLSSADTRIRKNEMNVSDLKDDLLKLEDRIDKYAAKIRSLEDEHTERKALYRVMKYFIGGNAMTFLGILAFAVILIVDNRELFL